MDNPFIDSLLVTIPIMLAIYFLAAKAHVIQVYLYKKLFDKKA